MSQSMTRAMPLFVAALPRASIRCHHPPRVVDRRGGGASGEPVRSGSVASALTAAGKDTGHLAAVSFVDDELGEAADEIGGTICDARVRWRPEFGHGHP